MDRMRNLRMLESDVMVAVRQKGLMRLEEVRYAVIDVTGRYPLFLKFMIGFNALEGVDLPLPGARVECP